MWMCTSTTEEQSDCDSVAPRMRQQAGEAAGALPARTGAGVVPLNLAADCMRLIPNPAPAKLRWWLCHQSFSTLCHVQNRV